MWEWLTFFFPKKPVREVVDQFKVKKEMDYHQVLFASARVSLDMYCIDFTKFRFLKVDQTQAQHHRVAFWQCKLGNGRCLLSLKEVKELHLHNEFLDARQWHVLNVILSEGNIQNVVVRLTAETFFHNKYKDAYRWPRLTTFSSLIKYDEDELIFFTESVARFFLQFFAQNPQLKSVSFGTNYADWKSAMFTSSISSKIKRVFMQSSLQRLDGKFLEQDIAGPQATFHKMMYFFHPVYNHKKFIQ
jgi:hypothetical protein